MPARPIKVWNATTSAWEDVAVSPPEPPSEIAGADAITAQFLTMGA